MLRRTEHLDDDILPNNEFINSGTNKKCSKKCGKGFLKCCGIIALTLGLNAFSFYVGYKVANFDTDNSDNTDDSESL